MVDAGGQGLRRRPSCCMRSSGIARRRKKIAGVAGTLMTKPRARGAPPGGDERAVRARGARVGGPLRHRIDARARLAARRGELPATSSASTRHTTGDGIISSLQVLTAMRESGKTLAELTADLGDVPAGSAERRSAQGLRLGRSIRPLPTHNPAPSVPSMAGAGCCCDPSGTEPVLRVMVEGEPARGDRGPRPSPFAEVVKGGAAAA